MSKIQQYIDQEQLYHTEGERGVRNLETLVKAIGYQPSGFRYGSAIEMFLQDNPGAIEAIQQWIIEQDLPEWNDEVSGSLSPNEDEEDLDEED